jgi:hypothetical protein
MVWDLGLQGIGVLALMSLALGVFTQVVFWGVAPRWLWLAATAASFVLGVIISEVWFGWATEAELQPNIDGLSFDEVLLGFLATGLLVLMARFMFARRHRPAAS